MLSKDAPYSWGDVADTLATAQITESIPLGLVKAEIYWDQATFYIRSASDISVLQEWLTSVFPQRFQDSHILLDGPTFSERLPVHISVYDADNDGKLPLRLPTQYVAASNNIWFASRPLDIILFQENLPTFAFHSVKGGVGRTTSSLAFAKSLAQEYRLKPLLVDADFEAPGISYLFLNDGRQSLFSLEDLLVLSHADDDVVATRTVSFGADKLTNQVQDGITILPCLRNREKLSAFAVRPEQL